MLPSALPHPPVLPTAGRIVYYRLPDTEENKWPGAVRPAIVVTVNPPGTLNLHVFHDPANEGPIDGRHTCSVEYSEEPKPRTWCWPPR